MNNYMFDTNVFNETLDQSVDVSSIGNVTFYVTHIQLNEIQATKNQKRKEQLLKTFHEVKKTSISTESAVWDVSEWGNAKWGSANGMYQPIVNRLGELNKKKKNNTQDSLIAETAIINKQILVTNDKDLQQVVGEFGGTVIDLSTFLTSNA
jgi:predicted nucleic acid-binding protein